jgi:hypothetical protein
MMENKISYLRLLLEFGQEPLWWYDSDSDVIDVGLIPEWEEDIELNDIMYQLSDAYDALFINTKHEFAYVGFKTDEQKLSFLKLADLFATKVYEKNAGKYKIVNDLKLSDWHSSICEKR